MVINHHPQSSSWPGRKVGREQQLQHKYAGRTQANESLCRPPDESRVLFHSSVLRLLTLLTTCNPVRLLMITRPFAGISSVIRRQVTTVCPDDDDYYDADDDDDDNVHAGSERTGDSRSCVREVQCAVCSVQSLCIQIISMPLASVDPSGRATHAPAAARRPRPSSLATLSL